MIANASALRNLLANTEALLLDFDGPVCSVFAGFPAHVVADQLRQIVTESSSTRIPPDVAASNDPFDVLKYATRLGNDAERYVEAAFRAHEVEAITTAMPTPGSHELIRIWTESGRPLAIVSNNSVAAVEIYLEHHKLASNIQHIAARTSFNVALLKPKPDLVTQAITKLRREASKSLLIGDSTSDIKAAHSAHTHSIGYANKPGKFAKLHAEAPDFTVTSLAQISDSIP